MNAYFDTSSWNHLVDHTDVQELIHLMHQRRQLVLASVITAGEVLRIKDNLRRQKICSAMRTLHGEGPLLEHPFDLAHAAAQAILQGQEDFCLPRTGPGSYLLNCILDASQPPPKDEIWAWLCNMKKKWREAKEQLNLLHLKPDMDLLPEVLGSDAFPKLLCRLPPAEELGVSPSLMQAIYEKSDVWKALGATVAYMIKPSTTHASKNKKGKGRPDAQDLWQAPYLGVVFEFVTGDELMLAAIDEISSVAHFRYPRRNGLSNSFFNRVLLAGK